MSRRPNVVLIITDQERSHKHWPPGWAEKNLSTHYDCLIGCQGKNNRSSVVFPNAFTATTECSPSRASLLTSSYPTEHGVKTTPGTLDPRYDLGSGVAAADTYGGVDGMNRERPNLLRLLSTPNRTENSEIKQQGYDVAWKGKWHLSPPSSKRTAESTILKWYGATSNWNPPDAGHSLWHSSTLGGGRRFNHDGRYLRGVKSRFDTLLRADSGEVALGEGGDMVDPYVSSDDDSDDSARVEDEEEECIFDFLAKHTLSSVKEGKTDADDQHSSEPFFLIASLVNPHDVWASSCFSNLTDDEFYKETGYHPRDFETLPIELPPNHKDDLSTKPLIQSILREHPVFGDLPTGIDETKEQRQSDALRYIRFYAHLHKIVDAEIGSLLDALDATGQMDNTIIIRMADHGELALSHGLREKRMQSYEETIGIPLVINYPSGWFDDDMDQGTAENGNGFTKGTDSAKKASSARTVPSLVSSIDILPTIAELAGVDCSRYHYRGKSLVPFLRSDQNSSFDSEQEEILFTFDEPLAPPGVPGFVRCIRTSCYKYAVYFTIDGSAMEYEMYNLETDPHEMINLCGPSIDPDEHWYNYHERLTGLMVKMGAVPLEFDWEEMSKPMRYSWA
eukprot:CAMPEP_0172307348 /NCGR_PEP_ID=MMETSP1058-20130122/8230_1 /TAXON_ID=83371 /ORGANISM="Detonula confervacea, Strain CCMP 353" /LENGTH=619 /DNA_ID=CAMNT_0013019495 /DNA_START=18 /DNA_END=1877 /DNA_ORIENTATION=+